MTIKLIRDVLLGHKDRGPELFDAYYHAYTLRLEQMVRSGDYTPEEEAEARKMLRDAHTLVQRYATQMEERASILRSFLNEVE